MPHYSAHAYGAMGSAAAMQSWSWSY